MATKTNLPEGMADLLDRIGRDTKTARLCVAGDYPAAQKWLETTIGAGRQRVAAGWADREGRDSNQARFNKQRASAYTALLSMLNELVTA